MKFKWKWILNLMAMAMLAYYIALDMGWGNPRIGKDLLIREVQDLRTGESLVFPSQDNSVIIFWASWCAPCKLEMERLSLADIPADKIFAINSTEKPSKVEAFIKESGFSFRFINDRNFLAKSLEIKATPTVVHLKRNKVSWMKSGMSLTGIWRAENLFDND